MARLDTPIPARMSTCKPDPLLPPELVVSVLDYLDVAQLILASHVCQQWRVLVYAFSQFTKTVALYSTSASALALFTASALALFTARICIPRARKTVAIRLDTDDYAIESVLLPVVTQHLDKLWRLVLYLNSSQTLATFRALRSPAPLLKSFRIVFTIPDESPSLPALPSDIFGGCAPELQAFAYGGLRLPIPAPPALAAITALVLFSDSELELCTSAILARFPKLDHLVLEHTLDPGRSKLVGDTSRIIHMHRRSPALRHFSIRMYHCDHDIFRYFWTTPLAQNLLLFQPSQGVTATFLENLPPRPLHLRLIAGEDPIRFHVELCCGALNQRICVLEPWDEYQDDAALLHALWPPGPWAARVTEVTLDRRVWAHPHIASWIPRLPNVTRLGLIINASDVDMAHWTPAVTLNLPAVKRLELSTRNVFSHLDARVVQTIARVGLRCRPPQLALGICRGVIVQGDMHLAGFRDVETLPRPFDGLDLDSMW
ncbi:hypothetical protein AURDEDRAFT_181715 [Auricularia subglabra TFB-10046 SS5]|nr:hypothetical protein AURDEDRAFT_181715 [Auricularia subglabra TFB-10046 SS5]